MPVPEIWDGHLAGLRSQPSQSMLRPLLRALQLRHGTCADLAVPAAGSPVQWPAGWLQGGCNLQRPG